MIIQQAFIISLIVLFVWYTYQKDQIFEFIGNWFETWVPKKLWNASHKCPACMSQYYGSVLYWIFFHVSLSDYMLTILTTGGISVIYVILIALKDFATTYKNLAEKE